MKKSEESLQDLWDTNKWTVILDYQSPRMWREKGKHTQSNNGWTYANSRNKKEVHTKIL